MVKLGVTDEIVSHLYTVGYFALSISGQYLKQIFLQGGYDKGLCPVEMV